MHAMNESEGARLMAHWRATGGAFEAHAFEAPCGDDRLAAVQVSTDMPHPLCSGDDGLRAYTPTKPHINCAADDGLKAAFTVASGGGICTDDGLAAMQFTTDMHPYARCSGDDGLMAVQFTVASGGGICTDDGLQAGSPTGFHIPGVCGDDGLEAVQYSQWQGGSPWCADDGLQAAASTSSPSTFLPHCAGDNGLQAGSPTGFHIPGVCGDDGLTQ